MPRKQSPPAPTISENYERYFVPTIGHPIARVAGWQELKAETGMECHQRMVVAVGER